MAYGLVQAVDTPEQPSGLVAARVVKVVDGDTIDVDLAGVTERLRLIGMDTPETQDPRKPVQCFGQEASDRAMAVLLGRTVHLEVDASQGERDKYQRLLRYVWIDDRLFNLDMIADGYAHQYTYSTPYTYQALFQKAEQEAAAADRGLWSPATCNGNTEQAALADTYLPMVIKSEPVPTATSTPVPTWTALPTNEPTPTMTSTPIPTPTNTAVPTTRPSCDPAYPDVCIPSPPPDLDCGDIPYRRFRVLPPDPHRFDNDRNGIGCES
jgi:micrococcal nuclease